jgi:hypothetical protein
LSTFFEYHGSDIAGYARVKAIEEHLQNVSMIDGLSVEVGHPAFIGMIALRCGGCLAATLSWIPPKHETPTIPTFP